MPQPRISIQSVPSPNLTIGPDERSHWISTSKDGSVKWIQETVHPITYKGKRAVLGHSMDVTAHREAMEKLRDLLVDIK